MPVLPPQVEAELCGDADADAEKARAAPKRLEAAGASAPLGKRPRAAKQASVVVVDSSSDSDFSEAESD